MNDNLELTRRQWAREKEAGLWNEAHLEQERKARRAWVEEQFREREQQAREQFIDKTQGTR